MVVEAKRRFKDPYVFVAGDFNQWDVGQALSNFADITEVDVGCTRNDRCIDKIFTNMSRAIIESGTLAPLETEGKDDEITRSDHRVAFAKLAIPRKESFKWQSYKYRHFSAEGVQAFKEWVVLHPWDEVLTTPDSNSKAEAYQKTIVQAIERSFPLKTMRKKSTDLPWMNRRSRKLVEQRKRLYWEEGGKRTAVWKQEKRRVDEIILNRKKGYLTTQKEHILANDANRNFFKHVKNFSKFEKPKEFNVRDLMPGKSDSEVAESLADYFNKVSKEFDPLEPHQIPTTTEKSLPTLPCWEVAARLKRFKVLGMHFSNRPIMAAHVSWIQKSFRARFRMLRNLKASGFSAEELIRVYKTMIRPVADYGAIVYHSSITDEQDELLDNLQNHGLKCVYGPGISAPRMRAMSDLRTLRARYQDQCDKFARKCVLILRMAKWFPLKSKRASSRLKREEYLEVKARCDRLKNSPFHYFRRRLNGKESKQYGKCHAEYREDR